MRHLVLILVLALALYFGWRYMPNRPRFYVGRFLRDHLPWVGFIIGLVIVLLYGSASSTFKFF